MSSTPPRVCTCGREAPVPTRPGSTRIAAWIRGLLAVNSNVTQLPGSVSGLPSPLPLRPFAAAASYRLFLHRLDSPPPTTRSACPRRPFCPSTAALAALLSLLAVCCCSSACPTSLDFGSACCRSAGQPCCTAVRQPTLISTDSLVWPACLQQHQPVSRLVFIDQHFAGISLPPTSQDHPQASTASQDHPQVVRDPNPGERGSLTACLHVHPSATYEPGGPQRQADGPCRGCRCRTRPGHQWGIPDGSWGTSCPRRSNPRQRQ